MAYIPHTDTERSEMLATIGVKHIDELYEAIPAEVRFPDLELPEAVSEMEIMAELQALSEANLDVSHATSFLGAGAY
ncbi:MAG: glycine dehydrogenase, partial [Anaerolineae bacterium]|nr:glycine dehydrogenase [Anaerolineae bacterium]